MKAAYTLARATLAGAALLALAVAIGWHVLVWRMGEVYRYDNRTTPTT